MEVMGIKEKLIKEEKEELEELEKKWDKMMEVLVEGVCSKRSELVLKRSLGGKVPEYASDYLGSIFKSLNEMTDEDIKIVNKQFFNHEN